MKTLETNRLLLRQFEEDDFASVQSYAGCKENIVFMPFGPNSVEETRAFISRSIAEAQKSPCANYQYAAVEKKTEKLIGACNLAINGNEAEIGWLVHRDYWRQNYGSEMGAALLQFGFEQLNLHRIIAHCDAENIASYKTMEKLGLRREGLFLEARPANKLSQAEYGDELSYAILKSEWETHNEIAYYNALPVVFDDFMDVPTLSDGEIALVCIAKSPANPEMKYVPAYQFAVCKAGEQIGEVNLRVGYAGGFNWHSLYYGGQVGYSINESHRGHGFAIRACRLLAPVAKFHGMEKLLITNNCTNIASRRVCEKLGARLLRVARLPEWHDLYKEGQRFINVFEWTVK
jgi:Acetyltransferases, including N-acetylases of ribosomal proteins